MFYEDVEEGKVYKSEIRKPISGTEIDIVAQLSGMDLPGFRCGISKEMGL